VASFVDLGILAVLAAGMASLTAVAVRWAALAQTPLAAATVQFILVMMVGMFGGVLVYFAIGGGRGLVSGFWAASAMMSASVVIVLIAFVKEVRAREGPGPSAEGRISRTWLVMSVVGLVVVNELLMGWSFSLLSGGLSPGLGSSGASAARVISEAITSPWFVFPMALEMVLTLRWLVAALPRAMRPFVLVQPAIMVCSPPTLVGTVWQVVTAAAASGLMALAVGLYLRTLFRDDPFPRPAAAYATRLILSLGLMAAGLYLWAAFSLPELFAVSLLAQMVVFLHASTDPAGYATHGPADEGRVSPAVLPA
jgi:hypothetical protein